MAYLKGIWKILTGFSSNNLRRVASLFASAYIFAVGLSCLGRGASGFENIKSVFGWLGLHDVVRWVSYWQEHTNGIVFTGLKSIVLFWFLVSCLYVYQSYSRRIAISLPQSVIAFSFFSALLIDLEIASLRSIFVVLLLLGIVSGVRKFNRYRNREDRDGDYIRIQTIELLKSIGIALFLSILAFILSYLYILIFPVLWFCGAEIISDNKQRNVL